MWVYLAGRYSRREELLGYAAEIDRAGHETCSTWVAGSHELPEGWDQAGQFPKAAETFAREDFRDLGMADVVVCFTDDPMSQLTHGGHCSEDFQGSHANLENGDMPTRGPNVELGIGLGLGQHLAIVGPRGNVFHTLPYVPNFSEWGPDVIKFLDTLEQDRNTPWVFKAFKKLVTMISPNGETPR